MAGKFKRIVPIEVSISDLNIGNVTCGTTKCSEEFHCFSQKKTSLKKFNSQRACRECGAEFSDWRRLHKRDISDFIFLEKSLNQEIIRYVFWNADIDDKALKKFNLEGKEKTFQRAKKLIKSRIGKLTDWDGRQTPLGNGDIINYAQHATATCCRKCLEAWHNIPQDLPLDEEQLIYCVNLIMKYIERKTQTNLE